jgi:hypothetical protein
MVKQKTVKQPTPAKAAKAVGNGDRKVTYPNPRIVFLGVPETEARTGELTTDGPEGAKAILGWEEVNGKSYDFLDEAGHKVVCHRNGRNRPLDENWARTLGQDMLNKHWRWNGQGVVLSEFGTVLSGQHELIGLVFAQQHREREAEKAHWDAIWGEGVPISMPTQFVVGVKEDPEVTRTLDCTRPRAPSDVFYSDPGMFGKGGDAKKRKTWSKMLEWAVRLLWNRIDRKRRGNYYNRYLTNSEVCEFVEAHRKIGHAIKHIYTENGDDGKLELLMSPGYASALLYLMGTAGMSAEDADAYHRAEGEGTATEKLLDFGEWEKACEFWTLLASKNDPTLAAVRKCRRPGTDERDKISHYFKKKAEDGRGTYAERQAILVNAWNAFRSGKKVTEEDLVTADSYQTDEDGDNRFMDFPSCGGIDLSEHPSDFRKQDDEPVPTLEEIDEAASEERSGNGHGDAGEAGEGETLAEETARQEAPKVPKAPRKGTRKDVEAQQTARAKEMDEMTVRSRAEAEKELSVGKKADGSYRMPEEVARGNGEPSATIAEPGSGKPPAPKVVKKVVKK